MSSDPDKTTDYQKLSDELELIINELQSSELNIDKVIADYERGIKVIDDLEKYLKNAKTKITKLTEQNTKSK
ncbi:MAG TPA: exodeoxyribonuclease VII small subunit [Candidatus Saccharimonadales bacterium]